MKSTNPMDPIRPIYAAAPRRCRCQSGRSPFFPDTLTPRLPDLLGTQTQDTDSRQTGIISAAPCCRNPRQHSGSTLLSAPPELFSLCLSQQTRRQWLPASPSGGSPPPLLSPVQHLCCPVLLQSATATLAASLKSQATKMRCNGSTTLRLVEQKQWKHKRTAVRASPGLLQHRKTLPFAA